MLLEREKIAVHGIVQGVGFRPFIHKLVQEYGLRGFIKNTSSGVELELEGERETLERFTEALPPRAPKLAVIESVEAEFTAEELSRFSHSQEQNGRVPEYTDIAGYLHL